MAVVLVRIDDRLIHGQVVVGWARSLRIERIVVANDRISRDEFQKRLMEISADEGMDIIVMGVNDAASRMRDHLFDDKTTLLLIENPKDALRLIEKGVRLDEINVGCMGSGEGRRKILPYLFIGEEEEEIFRRLGEYGVKIEVRALPQDPKIDLMGLMDNRKG
jgi:PTS system mannose-specific IIB component